MANTHQERIAENLKKIRTEGGVRTQRIGQILQTAFVETTTELKAGVTHIRPMAKEVTDTAVNDFKQKGQKVATKLNDAWTDQGDSPDLPAQLRSLLASIAKTLKASLFPHVKEQAETLDSTLTERYGERYDAFKQRLETAKQWYAQAQQRVNKEAPNPISATHTPVSQKDSKVTVDVVATPVELTSN